MSPEACENECKKKIFQRDENITALTESTGSFTAATQHRKTTVIIKRRRKRI